MTPYSPDKPVAARFIEAEDVSPATLEELPRPAQEKADAIQLRKLFRSRGPIPAQRYTRKRGVPGVGSVGVSTLEELQELMSSYERQREVLKATGLRTRQALHNAVRDASELLTREQVGGFAISRQSQQLVNVIAGSDDPLAQLCRFFLKLAPGRDRKTMALLMAVFFQIPIDSLVQWKP